jgi:hypothetical protein
MSSAGTSTGRLGHAGAASRETDRRRIFQAHAPLRASSAAMDAGLRVHGHPAKSPSQGCELGVMSSGVAGSAPDPQALLYCRSRSVRYADSTRWRGGGTAAAPLGRGEALRCRCVETEGRPGTGQRQPRAAITASSWSGARSSALPLIRQVCEDEFLSYAGRPGPGSASSRGSFHLTF